MKIAIFNKYQYKVNRGAETFVNELQKGLSAEHEVEIITRVNLWNLLSKKYDVYLPTNGRLQVFLIRIISLIKGGKMIVSGQSGPGLDDRLNLYTFPDVFIALTQFQKNWAVRINPLVKSVVIPNGVDLGKFKPEGKSNKNTVLAVGAFTKNKRHDLTIKAVAELPGTRLIIAGSPGEAENDLRQLGRKLLKDRFKMMSIAHNEMPQVYKEAGVLAFPTVPWESFGIVIVEAMASNLPVVATNDPIRKEIVGDAGILVEPENTMEFAKALKEALLADWGNLPRMEALKFSWDKIALKYLELIKDLYKR